MALTKPILAPISAFDATLPYTVKFESIGGSQVAKNKLVIRDNKTNAIVYIAEQKSYRFEHILAPDSLTNGKYYNAVISTFDKDNNESAPSNPIQFWCYSTPEISLSNLPSGNVIPNASFNFGFVYRQSEGEKLNSYQMNLYNSFKSMIATSGDIYVKDGTPPYNGEYLFAGFEDNTSYYVEVVGTTIDNTEVSTGLVKIVVDYIRPSLFTLLELTNNCNEGYITIESNIIYLDGKSKPSPPRYINDTEVDVTGEDEYVEFDEGFAISGDFLARIWLRAPKLNKEILKFSNASGQTITLTYRNGYENKESPEPMAYYELYVKSVEGMEYYIFSNYMPPISDSQYFVIYLRRVNNIYQLEIGSTSADYVAMHNADVYAHPKMRIDCGDMTYLAKARLAKTPWEEAIEKHNNDPQAHPNIHIDCGQQD